jgi:hypothetical protein
LECTDEVFCQKKKSFFSVYKSGFLGYSAKKETMSFYPSKLEKSELVIFALTANREEIKAAWKHFSPISAESTDEILYSAVQAGNVQAVKFLFESGTVTINRLRRTSLPHLFGELSRRPGGKATVAVLLNHGLDIQSPLSKDSPKTLFTEVVSNGVTKQIEFVSGFLGLLKL